MNGYVKFLGGGALAVALAGGAGWGWVEWSASDRLAQTFETHQVEIPVPFPLSRGEIAALEAERAETLAADDEAAEGEAAEEPTVEPLSEARLEEIALQRAIERGEHLVNARYVCVECHGADFGGGTMVDDPSMGTLLGPNITTGEGSVTVDYTMTDWDRIVRHGLHPDGTPAVMPSEDFLRMSDRELSDIVAYVRSMPPQEGAMDRVSFGPIGKVLVATGGLPLTAERLDNHHAPHAIDPPPPAVNPEFGQHLAGVCTGCHSTDLAGGTIPGGDPDWAPATNLTPHGDGLAAYDYAAFDKTMRTGIKPGGDPVKAPMSMIVPYADNMTATEMKALWAYLQSVDPKPGN